MPSYPSYPHPKTNKAPQSAENGLPGDAKTLIRGSDGLDYENLTARLLGEPAKTHRNRVIALKSVYTPEEKAVYEASYDAWFARGRSDLECHRAGCAAVERESGDLFDRVWKGSALAGRNPTVVILDDPLRDAT